MTTTTTTPFVHEETVTFSASHFAKLIAEAADPSRRTHASFGVVSKLHGLDFEAGEILAAAPKPARVRALVALAFETVGDASTLARTAQTNPQHAAILACASALLSWAFDPTSIATSRDFLGRAYELLIVAQDDYHDTVELLRHAVSVILDADDLAELPGRDAMRLWVAHHEQIDPGRDDVFEVARDFRNKLRALLEVA